MGEVKQASAVILMDGSVFDNCTVVLEANYVLINYEPEAAPGPDIMDAVIPWHQIKRIDLK